MLSHTAILSVEPPQTRSYPDGVSHERDGDGSDGTPILAESSLCTVLRSDDGFVYIQIGYVIVRLPERDVASLAGTLNRVVKQLFPNKHASTETRGRAMLRVIEGGDIDELPEEEEEPAVT